MKKKPDAYTKQLEARIEELETIIEKLNKNDNKRDIIAMKIMDYMLRQNDPMVHGLDSLLKCNPYVLADCIIENKPFTKP